MADLGNLHFGVHLKDYTDAEVDKIKKKLENLSISLKIDGKNVTVSQTDLIKKQIEDAVKSISVQSVKVDASSVKNQIEAATKNVVPQISVTLLKGGLSNDIQTYLNTKSFNIQVSIVKGQLQKDITTALSTVSVPVNVKISPSAVIQQMQQALSNRSVPVSVRANDAKAFAKDLEQKMANIPVKIPITADVKTTKQYVQQALQNQTYTAKLRLTVSSATVDQAIQDAFTKAGLKYSPIPSRMVNTQRSLGDAYRYASKGAYESARASVVLGRSMHANIRLAGELGTALGNFASVFGIKDVLQNLVLVGGQLENQRIALGAILQDGGKATEMFSKIQTLAVKSPFGIMDLNQYAKQLSAYSIPYNELYDTMKRMADISAGVGVDMGRIILAFGQVKAAGFLKGTELRQFTEANIPMVDKLAERFSNLEKRIVSAGEVYDMISKKKVTFEDVKSVLWDLTGEGGMFNNMQEVLSESLASKWKNLADAIDVMYGKIADGAIGSGLKNLAELLTELTKNWEYLATAIGSAAASYGLFKLASNRQFSNTKALYDNTLSIKRQQASSLLLTKTYRELTHTEQQLVATTDRLTIADIKRLVRTKQLNKEEALRLIAMKKLDAATEAYVARLYGLDAKMITTAKNATWFSRAFATAAGGLKSLGTALKGLIASPWTWITLGITAITELFTHYSKKQDEIEERNKNFAESAKGSAETLERELLKIKDLDISKMNTDEMKIKVKELTTVIQNEADGWQSILSEIFAKEADGTFKNSVEEQLKLLKTKMDELAEAKKKLMKDDESYSDVIGETETGALFWEKDIIDRVKAYSQAVDENDKKLKDLAIHAREVSAALTAATSNNAVIQQVFNGKSLNEQVAILKDYKEEWSKFIVELTKSSPEAAQTVNSWFNSIEKYFVKGKNAEMMWDFGVAKDKMIEELTLQGEEVGKLTETGRQYVIGFVDGLIKEAAVQKPSVQQYIYDWFTGQFGLPRNDLGYLIPSTITDITSGGDTGGPKKDAVAEMWKKRADNIAKAIKIYDDWKKVEGKQFAENRVKYKEELANLFNGKYGFNLDLENPTEAYEYIQKQLDESKEKQKELKIALGVKISDAELKDAQDELKDFLENAKKFVDNTVERWGLYKKLFESTGNKTLSMNIAFGGQLGFKNQLEQIEAEIRKTMESLGIGISFDELIKMDTQALEDAGWKGVSELIKGYNEEKKKLDKEQVDKFVDIIKSSKDFAQQIADIERELQDKLRTLRKQGTKNGLSKEELNRRENELIQNAEEEKTKVRFEEFKKSSDWVKVFDDLDRVSDATLDNMTTKIEEFARQGKISEEVTKQLVDAMAKLRKETIERNPFKGFEDAWKRLKYFKELNSKVGEYDEHGKLITQQMVDDGIAEANDDLEKASLAVADKFQAVANAADLLSGIFDGLGVDLSGLKDVLGGIAGGAQSGAGIAAAFGASGPWGAIAGAAIGAISGLFAQVDKNLQKEIEASERREKEIGYVAERLEKVLERNMGGIYTITLNDDVKSTFSEVIGDFNRLQSALTARNNGEISWDIIKTIREFAHLQEDSIKTIKDALTEDSYYDAQLAALKVQRDEVRKQMELEDEKKKTNEDKILDYKNQIAELDVAISHFAEDMANALYGIDFKDWASKLAESLVDAWVSGEDAAEAYKKTVNDILKDLGVSMISQQILEPMLNNTMKQFLAQFDKDNGKLTDSSMEILAGMADGAEYAAKATEAYLEGLKKLGIDLSEKNESEAGGLSKGIQSVTEDTANLLASYVNSMRADLSVNRTLIEQLVSVDVPQMSIIAQAQLQQLQQVAANTKRNADAADRIYELVNKVVDKGGNKLRI